MKVRELKEKRQALIDENQLLVDIADEEKRDLSEEEGAEFDTRQEEVAKLDKAIERAEKMEEYQEKRKAAAVGIHQDKNAQEKKEVQKFRFTKFIREAVDAQKGTPLSGFNKEMHQEAEEQHKSATGNSLKGFGVPEIVLHADTLKDVQRRDSTAGTDTEGGHTIATELSTNWISALRNSIMFVEAGATFASGLEGDIAIPRQTGLPTFTWSTENAAATETDITWDQVTLAPNRLNGFLDLSKQLIVQSSLDIERIIVNEMTTGAARAFDDAGYNGTGSSNQPTGIRNLAGTSDVPHGTNGAVPTWALTVEYETDVAALNALQGNPSYITNAKVRGKMKTVVKESGQASYLWDVNNGETPINGYGVTVSNAVPSNLTKGTGTALSSMAFGNWSDMLIGTWGGLDLVIDPFTRSKEFIVVIVVNMLGDLAYRHAESFSISEDIVTV